MRAFIGTSGWLYQDWDKRFYPEELPDVEKLPYFAEYFKTVEINSTFYHLPLEKSVRHWRDATPKGFLFSVKMSQYVTHSKRLMPDNVTASAIRLFYGRIRLLGPKLGVVLIQLPPGMGVDLERLQFLVEITKQCEQTYDIALPLAIEFRHASWFTSEVFKLLSKSGMMVVNNDSPNRWPATTEVTGAQMYIRFHGSRQLYRSSYTNEELAVWAKRIQHQKPKAVFAYFNNDYNAVAVENAQRFNSML